MAGKFEENVVSVPWHGKSVDGSDAIQDQA